MDAGASAPQGAPSNAPPPTPGSDLTAPAQPNPAMDAATGMILDVVKLLRSFAKAYPEASPVIQEFFVSGVPKMQAAVMAHQQPGEPMAPPT